MSWDRVSREVIDKVIADNPDADEQELRKLISAAYPFGERRMWPYKVWLREVKRAMARRPQANIEWPEWLRGSR